MKIKLYLKILLVFVVVFSFANIGYAQEQTGSASRDQSRTLNLTIQNPLKGGVTSLSDIISLIIDNLIMPIGSAIIVISIIWNGFNFIRHSDNPNEIKRIRESFLWILVGAGILLGAKGISLAIKGTFSQLLSN